jgi:hypothetical protein
MAHTLFLFPPTPEQQGSVLGGFGGYGVGVVRISASSDITIGETTTPSPVILYYPEETNFGFSGEFDQLAVTHRESLDLNLLKVELQAICTQYSLPTSGTKAEILDRIKQHLGIQ